MTIARDHCFDQQRCDEQDLISEHLYIQGYTDGYEGLEKTTQDKIYVQGYEEGLSQWIREERIKATVIDNYLPF